MNSPMPRREIVHRRIDQRDDENFLVALKRATTNNLRGERRERVRFARTGHSRNAKRAACVFQDFALRRTRSEGHDLRFLEAIDY